MAKFFGPIGYAPEQVETRPGVWETKIVEREYFGDVVRNNRRLQSRDKVNDDVDISNQISIISDPYAIQNFHNMLYAEFMGTKWRVTDVEVQYPRLLLTLGGIYHEQKD